MSQIFISYSRKDENFAEKIVQALAENDLDAWIDLESIPKGEDWWRQIQSGIEKANAFLFLISPNSLASKVCYDELNHAVKNGKRLLPIIIHDPELESVPEILSKLNWILCRDKQDDFNKAISEICETIHSDYEWREFHTDLQVKALKWQRNNHEKSLLLRGKELENTESMMGLKAGLDPQPVDLQREYLLRSRQVVNRQRKQITSALAVGFAMMVVITILAVLQWQRAEQQARIARSSDLITIAQSVPETLPERRLLLALSALKILSLSDPLPPRVENFFRRQISNMGGIPLNGHEGNINILAFSTDGRWLASGSDDETVRLWNLDNPSSKPIVLTDYKGAVNQLFFSTDGRWLLSASEGGTAYRWELNNLEHPNKSLKGDIVEFSPDGKLAALTFKNATLSVELLNLQNSHSESLKFKERTDLDIELNKFVFSNDGRYLIFQYRLTSQFIDCPTTVFQIWDLSNSKKPSNRFQLDCNFYGFNFSPDGQWLGASYYQSGKRSLFFWNIQNIDMRLDFWIQPVHTIPEATGFAFSPDGKWIALKYYGESIKLQKMDKFVLDTYDRELYGNYVGTLTFSPDGRWFISQDEEGYFYLWDLQSEFSQSGVPYEILHAHDATEQIFVFSPNNEWLVSGDNLGSIRLWNIQNPHVDSMRFGGNTSVVSFSPQRKWISTGTNKGNIYLWNAENVTSAPVSLTKQTSAITSLAFSSDEKWLISRAENNPIIIWNLTESQPTGKVLDGPITTGTLSLSFDGKWLGSKTTDGDLVLWNLKDRNYQIIEPGKDFDSIETFTFSHDGHWVIIGGRNGGIQLINLPKITQNPVQLGNNEFPVYILAVSPNDQWLVSVSGNIDHPAPSPSVLQLWDMKQSDSKPIIMHGHENIVQNLIFTPDSKQLIAVSSDTKLPFSANNVSLHKWNLNDSRGIYIRSLYQYDSLAFSADTHWVATKRFSVVLWDIQNPETDPIFLGAHKTIPGGLLAFSQDNRFLISDSDNNLIIWDLDLDNLIQKACQIAGRNLTRVEWAQYFSNEPYPIKQENATCPQWPL